MAAGLTAHMWTMEEVLSYRVPPHVHDRLAQRATNVTSSPFYTRYRGTPPISSRETVQAGWLSYVYTGVPRQIFDLKRAGFLRQNRHLPHKSFQFENFKAKLFLTRPILSLQRSP
jgi:hypothetical protein